MLDLDAAQDVLDAARELLDSLIYDPSGEWVIVPDSKLEAFRITPCDL